VRKRIGVAALLLAVSAILFGVGATLAFLATSSQPVVNTFTVGNVELSLTETTGENYQLIPGVHIKKDPRLTVKGGSDACWLFFRVNESGYPSEYVTYDIGPGWTALSGVDNVYYRQVDAVAADVSYPLLLGDGMLVKDTVTEEALAALQESPTLAFTGYAIQQVGIATAEDAWQKLTDEGVTGE